MNLASVNDGLLLVHVGVMLFMVGVSISYAPGSSKSKSAAPTVTIPK